MDEEKGSKQSITQEKLHMSEEENQTSSHHRLLKRIFPSGYCKEFKATLSIAWPLVLTQGGLMWFETVATVFGGHLGKMELEAIALSNTLIKVIGQSVVIGFSTSLDTIVSQAFGRGNYEMVGIFFQRGLILHFLILMPCYLLHLNIKPILLAAGQHEEVVELTSNYLLYFMPGMFCMFMWIALRKFTQCQNQLKPHIVIMALCHLVHALLQYLFLYQFKFGITGSSIALGIAYFLLLILTIVYTATSKVFKLSWHGWDLRCLLDWGPLASLGIFGMLMMCLEWWALEVTVILAGVLGGTDLAAQSVAFNLNSMYRGIPSGVARAIGIRVGQFLGAGETASARTTTRVGTTITVVIALVWSTTLVAAKSELPKIFTNDKDIINLVSHVIPLLAGYTFADAISIIGRGVFRGTGKQKWGTIITFFGYYIIALPISIPVTFFTPLGLTGIWIGFLAAASLCGITSFTIIQRLNWNKLEKEVKARVQGRPLSSDEDEIITNEKSTLLTKYEINRKETIIPKRLYVERILTVTGFILLPIAGIIFRLTTENSFFATVVRGNVLNTTSIP